MPHMLWSRFMVSMTFRSMNVNQHSSVKLIGQGMNCGFEDVRVLSTLLDVFSASPSPLPPSPLPFSPLSPHPRGSTQLQSGLAAALSAYSTIRAPSLNAIQELAASNYAEMASSVLSPFYIFRLTLDGLLSRVFSTFGTKEGGGRGGSWESLYRMVTFRYGLAYEEAMRRRKWQSSVLEIVGGVGLAAGVGGVVWVAMAVKKSGALSR